MTTFLWNSAAGEEMLSSSLSSEGWHEQWGGSPGDYPTRDQWRIREPTDCTGIFEELFSKECTICVPNPQASNPKARSISTQQT